MNKKMEKHFPIIAIQLLDFYSRRKIKVAHRPDNILFMENTAKLLAKTTECDGIEIGNTVFFKLTYQYGRNLIAEKHYPDYLKIHSTWEVPTHNDRELGEKFQIVGFVSIDGYKRCCKQNLFTETFCILSYNGNGFNNFCDNPYEITCSNVLADKDDHILVYPTEAFVLRLRDR